MFGLVFAAPTSEADGLEECDAGAGPQVEEVILRVGWSRKWLFLLTRNS